MPIIAKSTGGGTDFVPCPQGVWNAVCCDVVDLGVLEVSFGGNKKKQHKIYISWQVEEVMENNKPFLATKRYTLSLHEKAALRKDLESWRGRPFTDEELEGFDIEKLIGIPCMLNVVENRKDGKVYGNVTAIMRLRKGMEPLKIRDYVRVIDRKPEDEQQQSRQRQTSTASPTTTCLLASAPHRQGRASQMKTCFKCKKRLPLDAFYRHSAMADGYLGKCKECAKLDVKANYKRRVEEKRAYDSVRTRTTDRRAAKLRYQQTARSKHPDKNRARARVAYALRTGKIERRPCEVCGDPKSEAHHEDYAKPLDVRWLCFKHHRETEGRLVV